MKEEYGPFNVPAAGGEGYRDFTNPLFILMFMLMRKTIRIS